MKLKSIEKIRDMACRALEDETNLGGMTYQEGVANALLWAIGDYTDEPLDDADSESTHNDSEKLTLEENI